MKGTYKKHNVGYKAKVALAAIRDDRLDFYNAERQHQSLGYRTPRQIYQEGLWICGRSALPTGCASPASRASSESQEMLAFAHILTGATANTHLKKRLRLSHDRGHLTRLGANVQDLEGQIVVTPCRTERRRAGTAAGSEIHELVELFRGLFVADFRTWTQLK